MCRTVMKLTAPPPPSPSTSEHLLLLTFLDYERAVFLLKLTGLDDQSLRRPMVQSGMSILAIAKHLAYVERWWLEHVFAGATPSFPWTDTDPDADWRLEPNETTADILDLYHSQMARSRNIVTAADLDATASPPYQRYALRWILLHLIQETGRHAGHADIVRELIDGTVTA
jgi:uncharacterized damage-inducible protein DinB